MKTVGNIVGYIFGGILTAIAWIISGIILCVTVIGFPYGVQCFKYAKLSFSSCDVNVDLDFEKFFVSNLLWFIFLGWEMFFVYIVAGTLCCITVVAIPAGLKIYKLSKLTFAPFGAKIN